MQGSCEDCAHKNIKYKKGLIGRQNQCKETNMAGQGWDRFEISGLEHNW